MLLELYSSVFFTRVVMKINTHCSVLSLSRYYPVTSHIQRRATVKMKTILSAILITCSMLWTGSGFATERTEKEIDTIVRHSYQYVAMYNTNNNFAMQKGGTLSAPTVRTNCLFQQVWSIIRSQRFHGLIMTHSIS